MAGIRQQVVWGTRRTWNPLQVGGSTVVRFAHPVERELARLFDEHGLRWEYEPHTFVLERHADGAVRQAFTPDFYLPDLGVYVECTVMRPSLAGKKRQKVRKVREREGVAVEMLFARDFERLARRWSFDRLGEAATRTTQSDV